MPSQPSAQAQFSVVSTDDGSRVGKLCVPHRKSAEWINFLVSPRQQVQIVFAETRRNNLILYFQAGDRLYNYLCDRLNTPTDTQSPESEVAHHTLAAIAN